MEQRWGIALLPYDFDVPLCGTKRIPYVDYLSRYAQSFDSRDSDCLFVQPLPVGHHELVCESHRWLGPILSAGKRESNANVKTRFTIREQRSCLLLLREFFV